MIEDTKQQLTGKAKPKPTPKGNKEDIAATATEKQQAKLQKDERANEPIEKAKKYLSKVPTAIREVNNALNEAETPAARKKICPVAF